MAENSQIDDRVLVGQLPDQKGNKPNCGDSRQPTDLRGSEPVMVAAFIEHDLERSDPQDQENEADLVDHGGRGDRQDRSEEHTSELQTLMRISYAVFCLKKKKKQTTHNTNTYKH